MSANCLKDLKGLGVVCKKGTPMADINAFALLKPGFAFADAATFATLAGWKAAQAAGNIIIVRGVVMTENQKVEDDVQDTGYERIHNSFGVRGKKAMLRFTQDQHKIFFDEYNDREYDIIEINRNGYFHAVLNEDGTIGGVSLDYFKVLQQSEPAQGEAALTPVEWQHEDATQWDVQGYLLKPSAFRAAQLKSIVQVTLAVSTVATNVFTATVTYDASYEGEGDGSTFSVPISGLGVDDFEVIDQTGAVNSLVSAVEVGSTGVYTVTGDTLTSGTAQVVPNTANAKLYKSAVATLSA